MIGIEALRRAQTMAGMCIGLALTLFGGAPSFYISSMLQWPAAAQVLRGGARDVTATTQCLRGALSRPAGSAGWSCGLRPISQALRGAGAEILSPRRACEVGAWRRRRPAASARCRRRHRRASQGL